MSRDRSDSYLARGRLCQTWDISTCVWHDAARSHVHATHDFGWGGVQRLSDHFDASLQATAYRYVR